MNSYFKKKYAFDITISILVLFLIIFMYVYLLFPEIPSVKLKYFTITSNYQGSVQVMVYQYFSKIHLILLITLIYLTSSDWWKFFLIPIYFIACYQIWGIINEEGYTFVYSFFLAILLTITNLYTIFFLNKKLSVFKSNFYNIMDINILKEILSLNNFKYDNELISQNLEEENDLQKELRNLQVIKNNHHGFKTKEYLNGKIEKQNNYIIALFLVLIPFIIFSFKLIPEDIKFLNFGYIKIETSYIEMWQFVWFLSFKIALFILLTVWFITTKQIWKYAILLHIAVVCFQAIEIIKGSRYLDQYEILYALPILIPILVLLFFLARWLKYKSISEELNENIAKRIDELITKISSTRLQENSALSQLQILREKRAGMKQEDYYKELNSLKIAIENQMVTNN